MGGLYTTPFDVWDRTGRATRRQKTDVELTSGTVIQLEEHVLPSKLHILDDTGQEVDETNYEIDTDFNQLIYQDNDSISNATINYITAPASKDRSERGVKQATNFIDEHLDTTFNGLKRRVDEVYQTDGTDDARIMFMEQPVRDVEKVEINTNSNEDEPPEWEEIVEDVDWTQDGETGIKLNRSSSPTRSSLNKFYRNKLSQSIKQIRITYTYGFEELPADIQNLTEILLATDLFLDTVFGAGIDGRDGFNPQSPTQYRDKTEKIIEEWDREFYHNFSTLVVRGEEEDVE